MRESDMKIKLNCEREDGRKETTSLYLGFFALLRAIFGIPAKKWRFYIAPRKIAGARTRNGVLEITEKEAWWK